MKRKLLSLVLTLAMLASLLAPAFAAQGASFTDTDGHWAQASVDRWAGAGVMNGTGSGFQPDKTMTRAEFAQMLVNLLGYTEKAENTFKDVPNDAWFADAVLKLAAAGVMQGDGVNANPNAEISRAEMAVLLCRALNIQPKASSSLSFADAASVPSWAEGAMAALAERGMISGVGGNQVAPTLSVNRASVAKLLDNVVGVYANEPGQVISGEVKGLVIVVADGVTLKDATVAENIVVAPKAGGASLTVTGKSTVADVYVAADGAKLTVDKDAAAGDILVDAAKAAVTVDGKADAVMTTESASAAALSVGGTVSSVSLAGADTELKVSGTVKSVDISATASGADVNVAKGGSIDTVKTSADDVKIAGEGTVKSVEVTAGSGVAVDTKGTEVKVSENAETVLVNGKEVKPGETANVPSGGGGGGGGSNPGPSVTTYNVTFDANGGTFANPTDPAEPGVYVISDTVKVEKAPEQPIRSGYTFKGWYTEAEGGSAITFPYTPSADVIIHAQWDKNGEPSKDIYTIQFDATPGIFQDPGESDNNSIYTFTTRSVYAAPSETPVYDGYTFKGWYTSKAYTTEATYPTDADQLADAIYYAKWESIYVGKVNDAMKAMDTWFKGSISGDAQPLVTVTSAGAPYTVSINLDALHDSTKVGDLNGLATKLSDYIKANFDGAKLTVDGKQIYDNGAINHTALKDVLFGTFASNLISNFADAPNHDGVLYTISAKLEGASSYEFDVKVVLTGNDLESLAATMKKIGENLAITYGDAAQFADYGVTGESQVAVLTVTLPDKAMGSFTSLGGKTEFDQRTVGQAFTALAAKPLKDIIGSEVGTIQNLCGLVNSNDALVNKVLSKVTSVTVSHNTGAVGVWQNSTIASVALIAENQSFTPGTSGDNWQKLVSGISSMLTDAAKATTVGSYFAKDTTEGSLYIIPVTLHLNLEAFDFECDETIVVQLIVPFPSNS